MKLKHLVLPTIVLSACLLGACKPRGTSRSSSSSFIDDSGADLQTRVANITQQLSKGGKLPGERTDARFLEEKVGDGVLGPSDFYAFYALKVPVGDLPAWRTALAASRVLNGTPSYAAPKAAVTWWLTKEELPKLELFNPKSLTGRSNGWVGLAPDGRIFIYSFTM